MIEIDPEYTMDIRPVDYHEPKSAIASVIQRPAYLINQASVTAAYMKDWNASRKKKEPS